MISIEKINDIINEKISGTDVFLVEASVSKSNQINVFIDSPKGVDINTCIEISKQIENSLNREEEDFELNVSSAGIERPFKVIKQYEKNCGRTVRVDTKKNERITGTLLSVNNSGITIEYETKKMVEGMKRKQLVIEKKELLFEDIKETKLVISFK